MLLALVDQEYSWQALGVGHAPLTQRSLVFLENQEQGGGVPGLFQRVSTFNHFLSCQVPDPILSYTFAVRNNGRRRL